MTKRCPRCKTTKPTGAFAPRSAAPHRLSPYCRPCTREYQRQWHQRNAERRRSEIAAARRRRRDQAKALADKAKDVPCADCGKSYPPHMMDFDHVRGEKVTEVAAMVRAGLSLRRIQEEIAKCEVVCANCHRERTHGRRRAKDAASEERGIYLVPPERFERSRFRLRADCSAS